MGDLTVLQTIGISMGIDAAPFWANLHLSKHECGFTDKLINEDNARAKIFQESFRFIDNFYALTDGGEFQKSYKEIYHLRTFKKQELELWY